MEILLWKETKDNDLKLGTPVCYKNIYGIYSKVGVIDGVYSIYGVSQYSINNAIGGYLADELKLIKQ